MADVVSGWNELTPDQYAQERANWQAQIDQFKSQYGTGQEDINNPLSWGTALQNWQAANQPPAIEGYMAPPQEPMYTPIYGGTPVSLIQAGLAPEQAPQRTFDVPIQVEHDTGHGFFNEMEPFMPILAMLPAIVAGVAALPAVGGFGAAAGAGAAEAGVAGAAGAGTAAAAGGAEFLTPMMALGAETAAGAGAAGAVGGLSAAGLDAAALGAGAWEGAAGMAAGVAELGSTAGASSLDLLADTASGLSGAEGVIPYGGSGAGGIVAETGTPAQMGFMPGQEVWGGPVAGGSEGVAANIASSAGNLLDTSVAEPTTSGGQTVTDIAQELKDTQPWLDKVLDTYASIQPYVDLAKNAAGIANAVAPLFSGGSDLPPIEEPSFELPTFPDYSGQTIAETSQTVPATTSTITNVLPARLQGKSPADIDRENRIKREFATRYKGEMGQYVPTYGGVGTGDITSGYSSALNRLAGIEAEDDQKRIRQGLLPLRSGIKALV